MFPIRVLLRVCFVLLAGFVHVSAFAQTPPPGAVRQIALGRAHACAITQASALYCWGENKLGQVGVGKASTAVAAPALIFADGVSQVATDADDTCAIVRGALWCWGENKSGQAGGNLGDHVDKPVLVIAQAVTFVAVGEFDTCAVVSGALRCWGLRAEKSPVEVIHEGVSAVALGIMGGCAIVRGALDCWSNVAYHTKDIGMDSVPFERISPIRIIPAGVAAVAVGANHSCAIADGALWCWGENREGGIGNGQEKGFVAKPVRILDSGVTAVMLSHSVNASQHTCAVAHGALLCWGGNYGGQIDRAHPRHNVLTPMIMIPAGVGAIAEDYVGQPCFVVDARLRCRGFAHNYPMPAWPDIDIRSLPFDTGIGDIDTICPDTPAELAAQEKRELERIAAAVPKALDGALVSDGFDVYRVTHSTLELAEFGKLKLHVDAIPLYAIARADEEPVDGDGLPYRFRAVLPHGSTCGDARNRIGKFFEYAWADGISTHGSYRFYVQHGDRFTGAADAFHELTPLSSSLMALWDAWPRGLAFSAPAPRATDGVFRQFDACADAIARAWSQQPFATIRVGSDGDDPSDTDFQNEVEPRADAAWYADLGYEVNRVDVQPKAGVVPEDFTVEAGALSMMRCFDNVWLAEPKPQQAWPWKLARNGASFMLSDALRKAMDAEALPSFPPYTQDELLRAIANTPRMADFNKPNPAAYCAPAYWGDEFTIYYRGKPVQHLYVANASAPDAPSDTPTNPVLHYANRAGITATPTYAVAKPWPGDPARTILALALPEAGADTKSDDDIQSFALELLVMRTGSDEVLQRYHEDDAFTSDAMMFGGIALDTANYAVKPGARAFGLRASYSHNGYTSSEMTTLQLFLPEGRRLEPLTRSFVVSSDSGDRGTGCDSNGSQMQRIVAVRATRTHGHADLVVRETSTETTAEDCKKAPSVPQTTRHVLHFDGREYPVPGDWVE